jgi:hypothetical protein
VPIDHDYVQVAADGSGKKVGNVKQTDPDSQVVYLQKTVTSDPETATDSGLQRVTSGRAHTRTVAEVSDDVTATWTSATAVDSAATLDVAGYAVAVLQLGGDASLVAGGANAYFEASADGGTNWSFVDTLELWSNAPIVTYPLSNFDGGGWAAVFRADVAGLTHVRVRLGDDTLDAGSLAVRLRATGGKVPYAIVRGSVPNGYDEALGHTGDTEATGAGSVIAILKRLRTLLSGTGVIQQRAQVSEATGTLGALNATVELDLEGYAGAVFAINGTLVGTVTFEGKASDDTGWVWITCFSEWYVDYVTDVTQSGGTFWDVARTIDLAGFSAVRVRASAYTSGSAAVVIRSAAETPIRRISTFEAFFGRNLVGSQVDGHSASIGTTTDAAATANGSVIAVLKRLRELLNGGLPATLGDNGGLKVSPVAALPAGTNNIGDVDVASVPFDPFGANADAAVSAGATGSLSAKLRAISRDIGALLAQIPASLGQKTMANSLAVTVASDQSAVPVKEQRAATPAQSSVNDTNSNTTLLASNANRLGATIYNDSTVALYVKLGATASTTSFTVKMSAGAYYEVPFNYTGIIDGIWASDASGAARITELTT